MVEKLAPPGGIDLAGHVFVRRGCAGGWSRSSQLMYRCASCGDGMRADYDDFYNCSCGAMHLDIDAGRFGSNYGDENILTYEILPPPSPAAGMRI